MNRGQPVQIISQLTLYHAVKGMPNRLPPKKRILYYISVCYQLITKSRRKFRNKINQVNHFRIVFTKKYHNMFSLRLMHRQINCSVHVQTSHQHNHDPCREPNTFDIVKKFKPIPIYLKLICPTKNENLIKTV